MRKYCGRCDRRRHTKHFSADRRRRDGLNYYCRDCNKTYLANYYKRNRSAALQRAKAYRDRNLDRVYEYLALHPCVDCGEGDLIVLQFDHVRGQKIDTISRMCLHRPSSSIKAEIAKCEVRCANCHLRKTAERAGWRRVSV